MSVNFQDEEEVKDYLETIGTEYRFGCYSEKKPEVCHLLGDYLDSIKKDYEKAAKVYRSTCDDYGYAQSCLKYGNYSFLGKGKAGSPPSAVQALKYYEKGCDLKNADACLHSGLLLVSKSMEVKDLKRDFPRGIDFLNRSCEMNNARACFYLSGMHISGVERSDATDVQSPIQTGNDPKLSTALSHQGDYVVVKDMEKAFNFAYKACELKNMYACANLSQMYARGEGTKQSEELAEKFKKIALAMQDEMRTQQTLTFQQ